jgi:DNA-binding response OmpR family regulator
VASTIFVIDSSPAVRRMVEQISTTEGYDVVGFQDGPAALEAARKISPTLIITDYHLDNMTFSGFCKEVHKLDNLSDTFIIALTGATDRLEDSHLKALGVKAFLKKPFQSEHLLDLIKDLDHDSSGKNGGTKKRSWPPTSSATDFDDEVAGEPGTGAQEEDEELTIHFPMQTKPQNPEQPRTTPPVSPLAASTPPTAEPEEAMKGLFGQLLQSMSGKTEKKIAEMLPQMVSKELETHVAKAVEHEVYLQLGASVSQERLTGVIEPLLVKALPKVLTSEMAVLEPIIRHTIFEIATPLIKDHIELMVREQADAVKQSLPGAIREHLKSLEDDVRKELNQAARAQAEHLAADVVRTVAEERIQTTVQTLIPSLLEEQIRAEIVRLTQAA